MEAFALAILNSRAFDWLTRRRVELNLSFQLLEEMPFPDLDLANRLCGRVVELSGRLAARDDRFGVWAKAIGVPVGSVLPGPQRDEVEAELDALIAHLYGLSRTQVQHVYETFHRGWDHQPRLAAALTHFDRIGGGQ
jgi:hypothetical protein